MKNVYFITAAPDGKILSSGVTQETALEHMPGAIEVSEEVAPGTHYVHNRQVIPMGIPPSPEHVFDYVRKTWRDPRTLDMHKAAKLSALKLARDNQINGGFTWSGSVFDSDPVSQTRLLGLKMKAQFDPYLCESWRLKNNEWRVLSTSDVLAVWDTFESHMRNAFLTFANREGRVSSAISVDEVNSVSWE